MDASVGNRPLIWICLLSTLLSGCANGPLADLVDSSPFFWDDPVDEQRYGPTPAEQIAALREQASRAAKMEPHAQQQLSAELADRLQNEEDPLLRIQIVRALGGLPTPAAADALQMALRDPDVDVRVAAVRAFGHRGGQDAVRALAETLATDADLDVRLAATRQLGRFRDPAAIRALSPAVEETNTALQYRGVQSLKAISGRDYGANLDAWRRFARGEAVPEPEPPSIARRLRDLF